MSLRAAIIERQPAQNKAKGGSPLASVGIASASKKRWLRIDTLENKLDVNRLCLSRDPFGGSLRLEAAAEDMEALRAGLAQRP